MSSRNPTNLASRLSTVIARPSQMGNQAAHPRSGEQSLEATEIFDLVRESVDVVVEELQPGRITLVRFSCST